MGRARLPQFFSSGGGGGSGTRRPTRATRRNRENAACFLVAVVGLSVIGLTLTYLRRSLSSHGKRAFEALRYNYWFAPVPFRSRLLPPSDAWLDYRLGDAVIGRGDLAKGEVLLGYSPSSHKAAAATRCSPPGQCEEPGFEDDLRSRYPKSIAVRYIDSVRREEGHGASLVSSDAARAVRFPALLSAVLDDVVAARVLDVATAPSDVSRSTDVLARSLGVWRDAKAEDDALVVHLRVGDVVEWEGESTLEQMLSGDVGGEEDAVAAGAAGFHGVKYDRQRQGVEYSVLARVGVVAGGGVGQRALTSVFSTSALRRTAPRARSARPDGSRAIAPRAPRRARGGVAPAQRVSGRRPRAISHLPHCGLQLCFGLGFPYAASHWQPSRCVRWRLSSLCSR